MPVLDRDTCKTACEQDLACIAYTVLTRNYGTECRIYYHGDFIAEENLNWSQNAESGTKAYKLGLCTILAFLSAMGLKKSLFRLLV